MKYIIILDEGVVLDENNIQVAPCQSIEEPAFAAYQEWISEGNLPLVLDTRV